MPLSNIVRVSRHITYVAFKLNQGVTTTKLLASD
ncbi:hypothetical protein T03_4814 [Trichinella britovi]|uniref:Uncharacterized protein n=3 Tax=Trichinella TaxID=6333 RepID=A0A0V1BT96_TRIBR|nr:hypothetical protein T05_5350 [Trichinella murrelli]KRX53285.1 hypothetical protein T09_15575 [Trichinella sp. T9]KRY02617.1 hypothetical protein T12_1858 [Trichinella patagoniensis]KRY16905.1 hypothetical protein T03_14387 [Trichinella britovi]KRY40208.1 hypothetical protein T03_4814 [Trichinella britovi]